jgi:fibro-slime domain-containing protein
MIKEILKSQSGAAALIAAMVVSSIVLSIALSVVIISLNNKASLSAFTDSVQAFYTAETGVRESLMQIRKDPAHLIFSDLTIGNIGVASQFIEESGTCQVPPECQFLPGSGWWGEYFNYSKSHPDMEVNPYPGPTPTPTQHDWYDDKYKTHEQIDVNLEFLTSMWFPYDGTIWENKEGYAHDYHFGMHWRAKVTAPSAGNYSYHLASDDDSWVLVNDLVIVNNSGTHAANTKIGDIFLATGDNKVEVYFAERHTVESGLSFKFDSSALVITPWPEGCDEYIQCDSNIQATASTTQTTRKVRYMCDQKISNCAWSELIP